jgi:hypothetical protein
MREFLGRPIWSTLRGVRRRSSSITAPIGGDCPRPEPVVVLMHGLPDDVHLTTLMTRRLTAAERDSTSTAT